MRCNSAVTPSARPRRRIPAAAAGPRDAERLKRFAHALVGIQFQPIVGAADITDRHGRMEVATRCFEAQRFLRALTQDRQLELAECSLHSKQQPVIDKLSIVHAILVDHQAVYQSAEFQKSVPLAPITGQARGLQGQYSACCSRTECLRQQAIEAGARRTPSGAARSSSMTIAFSQPSACARVARPIDAGGSRDC